MASTLPIAKIDEADCPDLPGKSREQLLRPLNQDLQALAAALDGGITLYNLRCEVREITVVGPDEWVPLTLAANWAPSLDTSQPPPSWCYSADGLWVDVRGAVRWTGGGSPAAGALIATGLPVGRRWRHVVDATNAFGRVDSGSSDLRYQAGTATDISLVGVRYQPTTPALPQWASPVTFTLGEVGRPPVGRPEAVFVLEVARQDRGPPGPVSIEGWQPGPLSDDKRSTVRLRRINGLAPGVKYTLRLLVLLPD